jgi:hypothetical protein
VMRETNTNQRKGGKWSINNIMLYGFGKVSSFDAWRRRSVVVGVKTANKKQGRRKDGG